MADKYTSEFKAKVALDAVTQGRAVVESIAQKYDVSEDEVRVWAAKLQADAAKIFGETGDETFLSDVPEPENVTVSTSNQDFVHSVEYGVTTDDLNYSKLIFWASFIVGLIVVMAVGLVYFAQFSLFDAQLQGYSTSPDAEVVELKAGQVEELNSFGVVDLENGIYRIPIDSAINKIAID